MLYKIIVGLFIVSSLMVFPQRIQENKPPITLEQQVATIFGNKTKVAIAVFKAESGLKPDAINYNCIYNGKSKSCKKKDQPKAWSVDCGLGQINIKGKVCPETLLTVSGNLQAVQQLYEKQGLKAWVCYKQGLYYKYL